jgi:hypothetical protein
MSEVIHAFLLAAYPTGSFFSFLNQRGVCDFPNTFSPTHFSPLNLKVESGIML